MSDRAQRETVEAAATKGEVTALYWRVKRIEFAMWAVAGAVALQGLVLLCL